MVKNGSRVVAPVLLCLLALSAALVMLDAVYTYYYAAVPAATDTYDALGARLDDPLGFRQHWLAAAGHPNISINVVKQQQREHPALKPQQVPGVRCDNSCYKVRLFSLVVCCMKFTSGEPIKLHRQAWPLQHMQNASKTLHVLAGTRWGM